MKALTSFRSKALVQKLGPSSPRVPVHVSDKAEFCFTIFSRNDNKAPNFCFLKLFPNKGIYPVHALSSENQQVDLGLEHVEPQDQQTEQTNELKFVRVAFQLQKDCDFGEQFLIVGDDPMLGLWNPSDALPMTWSEGHIWTVELDMPAGKSIQYKFILKGKGGLITWQRGSDRMIRTWETMNKIIVCEDWENSELQKIVEEHNLCQPNHEPQLVSQMSTSAEILDNPQEELVSNVSNISNIEDSQIHEGEKPIAEPVLQQITGDSISSPLEKPMTIIAENIGSSKDHMESTSREMNKRIVIQQVEEFADGPINDDIKIYDIGYNGNAAAPLKNQEGTIMEPSLFDFEGGPVLVPGLIPPTEEVGPGEVEEKTAMDSSVEAFESQDQNTPENTVMDSSIEAFETQEQNIPENTVKDSSIEAFETQEQNIPENTVMDSSIEAFETQDQNIPETETVQFSKEQEESKDDTLQEISARINKDESQLRDDEHEEQFHLAPAMEDMSNSELIYGNALQNDIQWGRETVKKFLTKLGLL